MPRVTLEEMNEYRVENKTFFKLKNDKDRAVVRFMYNTIDDVASDIVHQVPLNDSKRYVDCLRTARDPVDVCPFCAAGMERMTKIFVLVYNEETGEVGVWDRGSRDKERIEGLCRRYSPLVSTPIEIERHGKPNTPPITYEFYPKASDGTTLEDLPEPSKVRGGLVLLKDAAEMEHYIETGDFPRREEYAKREPEPEPDPEPPRRAVVSRPAVGVAGTRRRF